MAKNPPAFAAAAGTAGRMDIQYGMDLRDWFAGQWVAAGYHHNLTDAEGAQQAYDFADAMLEARENGDKK
jgi:hypothetical protein